MSSVKHEVDVSSFDEEEKDNEKIAAGYLVPCRICEIVFARIRLTWRFCADCGKAFCDGEHGRFVNGRQAYCIHCWKNV